MRSNTSQIVALMLVCAVVAAAKPPDSTEAQPGGTTPTAQAQPATTQPSTPKVVTPDRGRQIFRSTTAAGGAAKTAQPGPQATVTLKPGEVPDIKFDTPVYDFGRVRAGTDVAHDFWFTNTGTGPLEILAVRPG